MEVCLFNGMDYLRKTISTGIAAHKDKSMEPDVSMKYFALKGNIRAIVPLYMMFVCSLLCLGIGSAQAGQIWFTYVPPYGTSGDLTGEVSDVSTADHKVLVYIYVGGWWTKPTWAEPMTSINPDGTWTCDITTGGASERGSGRSAVRAARPCLPSSPPIAPIRPPHGDRGSAPAA